MHTMRIWSYFYVNLRNINGKYYLRGGRGEEGGGEGALRKDLYGGTLPRIPTPSL